MMTRSSLCFVFFSVLFVLSCSLEVDCSTENSCSFTTILCDEGTNCTILCYGEESCTSTTIESNSATTLNVYCSNLLACTSLTINCQSTASGCILRCTSQQTCKGTTVLICGTGDCITECDAGLTYYLICAMIVNATLSSSYQCTGPYCYNAVVYTVNPTPNPTILPTHPPTFEPTYQPSETTDTPSLIPTYLPSNIPSNDPTNSPLFPTYIPSYIPSKNPSLLPTVIPSYIPSNDPTNSPLFPTYIPSYIPSKNPSSYPTYIPTIDPTSNNIQNGNWTGINIDSNSSTSYNIVVWIVSAACVFVICVIVSAISLWFRKKREGLHASTQVRVTPGATLFTMQASTSSNVYNKPQISYNSSLQSIPYFSNVINSDVQLSVMLNNDSIMNDNKLSDVQLSSNYRRNIQMTVEEPIAVNIDVNVEGDGKLENQQPLNENRISIDSDMNVMNKSTDDGYDTKGKIDCDNDNSTAGNIENFDTDTGNVNDDNFNNAGGELSEDNMCEMAAETDC